jgi:hypothetical protein
MVVNVIPPKELKRLLDEYGEPKQWTSAAADSAALAGIDCSPQSSSYYTVVTSVEIITSWDATYDKAITIVTPNNASLMAYVATESMLSLLKYFNKLKALVTNQAAAAATAMVVKATYDFPVLEIGDSTNFTKMTVGAAGAYTDGALTHSIQVTFRGFEIATERIAYFNRN